MKLNLGCGNDFQKGYINHDLIKHSDKIDIVFDLDEDDWGLYFELHSAMNNTPERNGDKTTFKSSFEGFDEIRAWDVIEHLNDPINFMDNCWQLLKENGVLTIKACGWKNPNYYVDITHKRGYDIRSFDYFDPTTELGQRYSYYTSLKWKIISLNHDRHSNVLIKLRPVK